MKNKNIGIGQKKTYRSIST